jgi:hypothetical protein
MTADVEIGTIFDAFSVPATVTIPGGDAVATRVVWVSSTTEDFGGGLDIKRRDRRRVVAVRRDEVPVLPLRTVIVATEPGATVEGTWRVDGFDTEEADCVRCVVVPTSEAT